MSSKGNDMFKQVLVVRKDLKMEKGKLAAQVAHASLEAYKKADIDTINEWEDEGMKKVVLAVNDLIELMKIKDAAKSAGLAYAVIRDAGRTQLEPGTVTVLGIGPAEEQRIDRITKNLKLL
jgi:PTH2 family peptidyl-tRNA hydrolase